ncbi:MAG: class I tRNA ligase family protein, partial [Clostridia bacterium]|nr:class I tRNA ligase family protein [Clostridia bacterium]
SEKMSKSRGNVVNPDDIVNTYGADTLRLYEMFIGDFEKAAPWSENGVKGCRRFLDRVYNMAQNVVDGDEYSAELEASFHKTIKKVTEDIEALKFNTAIAAMMALLNEIGDKGSVNKAELKTFLTILSPFAPHLCEELWQQHGFEGMLANGKWAEYDESKTVDKSVEIPVQINGKLRATITVSADAEQADILATAKADEKVKSYIDGKQIVKEIYVKGRMVNLVIKG